LIAAGGVELRAGVRTREHGLTSQRGLGGCSPQIRAKPLFFQAKANFLGQKSAAKNEKIVAFIKRKNGIHSVERDTVPEIRDFY